MVIGCLGIHMEGIAARTLGIDPQQVPREIRGITTPLHMSCVGKAMYTICVHIENMSSTQDAKQKEQTYLFKVTVVGSPVLNSAEATGTIIPHNRYLSM